MGGKAMVGNMIRVLRARMTLLAVDEAGMSTVDYSIVSDYNLLVGFRRYLCRSIASPGQHTVQPGCAAGRQASAAITQWACLVPNSITLVSSNSSLRAHRGGSAQIRSRVLDDTLAHDYRRWYLDFTHTSERQDRAA
jgi:hypothetical protein